MSKLETSLFPVTINRGRDSSVGIAKTGPGAYPAPYTMGTGSFPGVKRPGRGVDNPPHLAPRLKKEYSYTCTPVSLRGLFKDELYLYLLQSV